MQQTTGPVVIRKYPNRRLYDTSSRRYVNLDDLAALVRQGTELQVVDAKTGEDLTRVVLTQIIVEDAKGQQTGLPLELLRQLIVASDRAGQEVIMWYLKSAFDTYRNVRTAALSPLTMVKNLLGGSDSNAEEAELEQLRRRVAELEARLEKTGTAKKKSRA